MKTEFETATTDLARRVPPHSVEAERAVLAGLILRPSAMGQIAPMLHPEDFYLPAHQTLYAAALGLHTDNRPVDLVTLAEHLRDQGSLEQAGGAAYIADLAQSHVSAANAEYYAKLVRDKSIQRGLIEAGAKIVSTGFDTSKDLAGLIDEAEQSVMAVSSRTSSGGFRPVQALVGDVVDAVLKPAEGGITGLATGYPELDAITRGLQPSDLIIIAARPAMGKTALALNLAMRAAISEGAPVGIFSLEMSEHQLVQRMISLWGKIPQEQLSTGRLSKAEGARFFETADLLRTAPLFINETPAISTLELRSQARRLKAEHGLGLIVVDYLQLMRSSRRTDSRELEISDISRSLKAIAKELDVPVVALSQLNRKVEERKDNRPMLSDLRESGSIEQDADIVIFLYRDEVYKPDTPKKGIAELIIGKHRNGRVGTVELAFLPQYTAFEPLAKDR
ncbi:replicative DNA helicase [Bilophila wadsworthia]|uniref:replicative DNA helicase n=1 Tax=Bilophila wadsworthia TaxID=35833 RepID=UPI00243000EC|nr:replicative DNA helicase [Bilophila wadsworthia]